MGGGSYDGDVARRARSTRQDAFSYRGYAAGTAEGRRGAHPALSPEGTIRECLNQTPIVLAMDVTRSRGDDSRLVYEKLPMLMGQLELNGYVEGAAVSFAAIGDADSDLAPLQVGQFEADNRLDEVLSRFWLEEGGGGTGQESYELAAYYYAYHTRLACHEEGRKGYFFFVGDEGFYPTVKAAQVQKFLGRALDRDLSSAEVFAALQEKFEVFFLYPRKPWQDRKADIDAEIKKRVEAAGGLYDGVDVRASLLWNNRNDLDLHVICPSGEEIYYAHKQSRCGGWLDVDMNVQGETIKPVENVRWKKGEAPAGRYRVFVQNYRFHDPVGPTEFRVELEINGEVQHFDKVISPEGQTHGNSNVIVAEFDYQPGQRRLSAEHEASYAGYDDALIKRQWASVLPPERILPLDDPRAIIDVVLGVLALGSGKTDLDGYLRQMQDRQQGQERVESALQALRGLVEGSARQVAAISGALPSLGDSPQRISRGHRL